MAFTTPEKRKALEALGWRNSESGCWFEEWVYEPSDFPKTRITLFKGDPPLGTGDLRALAKAAEVLLKDGAADGEATDG